MKKILRGSLLMTCAAILSFSTGASADTMEGLSWFGNTGATSLPVKDAAHSGYWWWPDEPTSNTDDTEIWGNRGHIYNLYTPPSPPAPAANAFVDAPPIERPIPIFNSALFDFDKSIVKPAGIKEIARIATELKAVSGDTVTVEGHTDNVNNSGDPQYNQKLGQRRADAVAKVLIDNGVAASRIVAISKGDSSPAVPNSSGENRAKNRRVVFKIKISQ